jgi:superfamily II DNA/RNA helicase
MKEKEILANITNRLGIKELNEMQQAVVSAVNSGRSHHVVLLAPTGSGKTVAFSIPLLRSLGRPQGAVQAVVIAPSRELVIQIYDVVRVLATGYKTVAFYGGHSMRDEVNSLSVTPDIIIATPGRLLDHINRGQVELADVETLVLDEYDKSLELGFHEEMRKVVRRMKHLSTIVLTSATRIVEMPDFVKLVNPLTLDYTTKVESPRSRIDIVHVPSPLRDKLQTATDLIGALDDGNKVILFVNHRESAERVYNHLVDNGFPVGLYHGGLDQQEREIAINLLSNGTTPILVSTDLGARGLDIEAVSAVIHYHLPVSQENWTHRNGRTARVDATGTVYVITAEGENVPEYIEYDREWVPSGRSENPIKSSMATLYINAGKKEKISRGDVAGYVIKNTDVEASAVGRIIVSDHYAIVAVPADSAMHIIKQLQPLKLKNKRVRVSLLK